MLNCLAGEEVALVGDIPGTTRDVISQAVQIRGVSLHILDAAGLREPEDALERMGIACASDNAPRRFDPAAGCE